MKNGKTGETYNVGGDSEMENIAIVEIICDILDEKNRLSDNRTRRDLITFVDDRPGHDWRYAIDFTKLNRELNWSPESTLEIGIRDTIQWYLNNRKWVDRVKSGEYQNWIKTHYK
jgi:dTDP-glucose 4,6-dehydratase